MHLKILDCQKTLLPPHMRMARATWPAHSEEKQCPITKALLKRDRMPHSALSTLPSVE